MLNKIPRPRRLPSRAAAAAAPADAHEPPHTLLLMLEGRAPWEFAALIAASPWLRRWPKGDGHPVVVFPGLGANDVSTAPLRLWLDSLGYETHPWRQGFNFGPRPGVIEQAEADLQRVFESSGRKASLLGWSLGGIYARELAKRHPEWVRNVITLGTPFAGHPRATHAWRFFEMVSGHDSHDEEVLEGLREPPPVPTTSIYSRSDGVVSWRCSVNEPAPQVENIEVHASHLGLGLNPLALYAVADRLAQPPMNWQPFNPQGAKRWFYPNT